MRRMRGVLAGLLMGTCVSAGWALAQGTPPASPRPAPGMMDLGPGGLDRLLGRLEQARRSNDPAQMRAAIDQAIGALTMIQDHMAMMHRHMQQCPGMHGGKHGATSSLPHPGMRR